jgi:hypothetical protein
MTEVQRLSRCCFARLPIPVLSYPDWLWSTQRVSFRHGGRVSVDKRPRDLVNRFTRYLEGRRRILYGRRPRGDRKYLVQWDVGESIRPERTGIGPAFDNAVPAGTDRLELGCGRLHKIGSSG